MDEFPLREAAVALFVDGGGEQQGEAFDDAQVYFGLRDQGTVFEECEAGLRAGDAELDGTVVCAEMDAC